MASSTSGGATAAVTSLAGVPLGQVSVTLLQAAASGTSSVRPPSPPAGTVVKVTTWQGVINRMQSMVRCADAAQPLGLAVGPVQPERNCTRWPAGAATVTVVPVKLTMVG